MQEAQDLTLSGSLLAAREKSPTLLFLNYLGIPVAKDKPRL